MAAAAASTAMKGGFWVRVVAYLIDVVILIVVAFLINTVLSGSAAASGLNIIIDIAYFLYFWSGSGGGQTPGMRVMNLKVVRTDGSDLDIVRALVRYVGLIIASIPILIGVIWVAFDSNKQGWHDKIAGTYVVKTK